MKYFFLIFATLLGLTAAQNGIFRFLVTPKTITSTVTVTSSATTFTGITKSCFTSSSSLTNCRRRRHAIESPMILEAVEDDAHINPSAPVKYSIIPVFNKSSFNYKWFWQGCSYSISGSESDCSRGKFATNYAQFRWRTVDGRPAFHWEHSWYGWSADSRFRFYLQIASSQSIHRRRFGSNFRHHRAFFHHRNSNHHEHGYSDHSGQDKYFLRCRMHTNFFPFQQLLNTNAI